MFKINNHLITTDPYTIINHLHEELLSKDIDLIRDIKPSGNNIQFTCPWHNGGKERKASCGVSVKDTKKNPAGTVHCFTCNKTSSIQEMISNCFGYDDGGRFGTKWLFKNFISVEETRRSGIELDLERRPKTTDIAKTTEDLSKYAFYHPYMYKRKLTNEIIDKFDVGYDKETNCVTFPVYDEKGIFQFVARRNVDKKLFNYPAGSNKPVYGLYIIGVREKEVIVCESIFNALTCWVYGKPAVALLGLGTESQYKTLARSGIRKFILAFDGDKAGRRARERFKKAVSNKLITYYDLPEGKDINDLSYEEFINLVEHYN